MDCPKTEESEEKEDKNAKPAIILRFKRISLLKKFVCAVCPSAYGRLAKLQYHVRRAHYNLLARMNTRDERPLNDVWLERVGNSAAVVQITKAGPNKFLMRRASEDGPLAEPVGVLDLAPLYPRRPRRLRCSLCKRRLLRTDYRRHLEEDHGVVT